jgi:hypothetical protein
MKTLLIARKQSPHGAQSALHLFIAACLLCAVITFAHTPCAVAEQLRMAIADDQQLTRKSQIRWWTLTTKHFNVHFHDGLADVANEVAFLAERSYAILEAEFGDAPDVIDLVITDQVDMTNGFAVPMADCITMYTANLRWSDVGNARNASWLEALLFHELVHEIELNQVRGGARLTRLLFGKIVMPNSVKPIPFIEGLAIYEKYKFLGESRVSDSRTRMMARQMAMDDAYPTFEQISCFYQRDSWPPSHLLGYNFGALFMKHIEQVCGYDALSNIADIYATGSPISASTFQRSVRKALGVSVAELYEGFIDALRKEFSAEIESITMEGLTPAVRLTNLGGVVESPTWSPKTGLAAYANHSAARSGVRLIDPLDRSDEEVFACIGYDSAFPGLSPDGEWVVYSKPEFDAGPYLRRDIYVRNLKSGANTRLTQGERAYYARFSPDGREIYFAKIEGHDGSSALCAVDTATREIRTVRSFTHWRGAIHSFEVSPGGHSIALAMWRPGGHQDIYLMSCDGGELVQITSDLAQDCDPTWTPDGRHILFSSDPDGIYNIYSADIETGEIRKVTNVLTGAFFPAVSPSGASLLFVGYGKHGHDLFISDLDIASARPAPRTHDPIPEPEPCPAYGGEITPYAPLAHMTPKFWLPTFTGDTLGLLFLGLDPVGFRSYIASLGVDLANAGPTYELVYVGQQYSRFPLSAAVSGGPKGNEQSIALSLPTWGDLSWSGGLTLGYQHSSYTGKHTHLIVAEGDLSKTIGHDLLRSTMRLNAQTSLASDTSSGPWTPGVSLALENSTRLPMLRDSRLILQFGAGWTGSGELADKLHIGGHEGEYPVRGVEHGYDSGTHVLRGSAEYVVKVAPIETSLGPTSIFIDDFQASVFIDAGSAGQHFTLNNSVASLGVEFGVSVVPGYTDARTLVAVGLAKPIAWSQTAPEPSSNFTIYLKLSGAPL